MRWAYASHLMSDFPTTAESLQSSTPIYQPASAKLDLPRALRALRALLRDKENTTQVFEIMRALNGRSTARGYRRLLRTAQGGRQAYEREELIRHLDDDAAMVIYPPGTLGAEYLAWRISEGLSAEGLAQESRKGLDLSKVELRHPYAWFGRRIRDVHDLWHILSGYGRDGLGEACLVSFSFAQTRGLGWALIALGAALNVRKLGGGREHVAAIWEGYQRGRKAEWLLGEDYRIVLAEPVETARQRLGISPALLYDAIPAARRNRIVKVS
ncbi:Coq4 family protein [Caulobacter sp. S45]|uniref:Coq4 family protein n=1 Tax=Caulobacter sp. S45 TaxID=1641861 RepID=UPI0020B126DC|nr:Coq4 family protein [Caulobacter sp. S45]